MKIPNLSTTTGHNGAVTEHNPGPVEHDDKPAEKFTPQITAKQSQRINAPARGMIISMAVLILLALPFFLLQPRPDGQTYRPNVDVSKEASYAADVANFRPLAPEPGDGYSPNFARWQGNTADGVDVWETGWMTPSARFIELVQTDQANPTWLAEVTEQAPKIGTREAYGTRWDTYHKEDDKGQVTRAWVGQVDGSTVVLTGTASEDEFHHFAQAVAADHAAPEGTSTPSVRSTP